MDNDFAKNEATAVLKDKNGFQRLGNKALRFFVLEHSAPTLLLIVLECVLIVVKIEAAGSLSFQNFAGQYPMAPVLFTYAIDAVLALALIVFMFSVLRALTLYASFTYRVDQDGFALRRGIVGHNEISLPFRQIQNVDIDQPLSYRIFGMGKVTILTAGHEDKDSAGQNESEIELPALAIAEARTLQRLLLDRANVQMVRPEPASVGSVPSGN